MHTSNQKYTCASQLEFKHAMTTHGTRIVHGNLADLTLLPIANGISWLCPNTSHSPKGYLWKRLNGGRRPKTIQNQPLSVRCATAWQLPSGPGEIWQWLLLTPATTTVLLYNPTSTQGTQQESLIRFNIVDHTWLYCYVNCHSRRRRRRPRSCNLCGDRIQVATSVRSGRAGVIHFIILDAAVSWQPGL